jgi:hypothetical protein
MAMEFVGKSWGNDDFPPEKKIERYPRCPKSSDQMHQNGIWHFSWIGRVYFGDVTKFGGNSGKYK